MVESGSWFVGLDGRLLHLVHLLHLSLGFEVEVDRLSSVAEKLTLVLTSLEIVVVGVSR